MQTANSSQDIPLTTGQKSLMRGFFAAGVIGAGVAVAAGEPLAAIPSLLIGAYGRLATRLVAITVNENKAREFRLPELHSVA